MGRQAGWSSVCHFHKIALTDRKCLTHMSILLVFPHKDMLLLQDLPGGIDKYKLLT